MRYIYIGVIILSLIVILLQARLCLASDYNAWIAACAPHRPQVESILTAEGLSLDYYYLMIAESRCTPEAISSAGAIGYWQLMPATARHYGCSEPHDLECATKAAAGYLASLSARFEGNFEVVIMAYNQGGHNLRRNGPTAEARSLLRRVKEIMKLDKSRQ